MQATACVCFSQTISGTGTYKGADPGWDRGMQTTMHCGNDPESWVRGSATLNKQSGVLSLTVQLETDSILAGPKGRVVITIRDSVQKPIYIVTSDEVGTGGRTNKAAIRNFSSTVMIPIPIAMRAESLFLDARCTGHVTGLFNLNLQASGKMFGFYSSGSSLEVNPGTPEARQIVDMATQNAQSVSNLGTPKYTATLRTQIAGLGNPGNANTPGALDQDTRYRDSFSGQTRVWGGDNVPPGAFPDTVAIIGNGKLCTGTVIGPKTILTAAHCFCDGVKETLYFGDTVHNANPPVPVSGGKAMIACNVPINIADGDVAILTVDAPLTIPPRAIASKTLIDNATFGRAVGYGVGANPIMDPQGIKRMVDVPVASIACNGNVTTNGGAVSDAQYYHCSSGTEIVAGAPSLNKDTCNGDSGGPMYVVTSDGGLYLAATVSRATGTPGIRPCGDGGIYVRIDGPVLKWIQDQGVHLFVATP